ncbi:MAG TPA: hypothetical protein DCP25_17105 [Chloroflexi bacterium]|nr:hypothetical protein [Chloroflexota bacterium]
MNIGLGTLLLSIAFLGDAGRSAYLAPLVLLLVGMFTALQGFMWLLPWRPYGVPSDGLRLWSLLTGSTGGRRWLALKEATAQSIGGVRPRDWPADLMRDLVVASDGSTDDIAAALTLYWHLLDSHRLTEARACLEQARAAASQRYMAELNSQTVLLELAYMESRVGDDPAVAVDNLMRSAFVAKATLLRVVAAISLSYADLDGADKAVTAGMAELPALRPGYARMEADLLTELGDEARQRREGGPVLASASPSQDVRLDVSRFAAPDVPLQEPALPPGLRSARSLVGFVGSGTLALAGYASIAAFVRGPAPLLALLPALAAALVVLRVRASRGRYRLAGVRTALAALAVLFAASPLFVSDLLRLNGSGYIWIAGQARPCTAFGTGHDLSAVWVYLFAVAIAMGGLLIGTRARREALVPRAGVYLGVGLVVLWIVAVASDHAHFAAVIGCAS